ncbi:ubiquitin-protein ligase [Kwoniella heveanensis BCC8398]|uniref:E3 ubiquitin-protein ligase n=1 Tax=Kwoniella heveanensis BCC8398 TaxID=1296120 RepID=A0A1B9H3Q2_9TREE|nr:ubiquitin-protein ligase [Kwoniella heveanensis BCC8398]
MPLPGERFLPSLNPFSRNTNNTQSPQHDQHLRYDQSSQQSRPGSHHLPHSPSQPGQSAFGNAVNPTQFPIGPSDPHKALSELLQQSHLQRGGRFSNTVKAAVVRALYQTIWQRGDWQALFIPSREKRHIPSVQSLDDWVIHGDNETSKIWSCRAAQKQVEKRRKESGEEPLARIREGQICGKVLQRFERTFTCKTCAITPSVVLCADCFKASDHEGHEVLFGQSYSFSASCDCGDPTAWRTDSHLGCSHHPPLPLGESPKPLPTKYELPDALLIAIHRTIVICLEFIIQVLQHSSLPSEYGHLPKTEEEMLTSETITGEPKDRRGKGPWGVVMWQDEKHVLREMTRQVRDALGVKWEVSEQWVREVDEVGRKVIFVSSNHVQAFHAANMIQQIDAPVSLRLAADVFREELVGVLISWLCDLSQCTVGGDDTVFRRMLAKAMYESRSRGAGIGAGTPLIPDLKELEWGKIMGGHDVRRLDWLLQLDSRLWKKPKWEMRQIYCSVLYFDMEVRKDLASRFAINYPRLIEHYLFQDRELDTNIIYSSAYLIFTNGQVCAATTSKGHLFTNVVHVAHAWYTGQVVKNEGSDRLLIPPNQFDPNDTSSKGRLDLDLPAFRAKKGLAILGHLRSIFRHTEMRKIIVRQPQLFNRAVAFINMFVGVQPQRREQGEHVEYEVDWLRSFVVLGDLAKMCREFGEAFTLATPDQLLSSMAVVINRILCDMMLMSNTLDKERYIRPIEHDVENVLVPGSSFTLVKQSVSRIEAFSFHHYMNLLLAEMLKAARVIMPFENGLLKGLNFREVIEKFALRSQNSGDGERMKLMILEYPMQKHVVLSQIRADMWKKNGQAMRMQYHHYREMGVREATLDQEFFLLQFGLCAMDPFKFVVALIDRYGLAPWFRGNVNEPALWLSSATEPKQRINLFEDFLLLMIHLVSYPAIIDGWSRQKITRKHIIHQLAVQPMSYSEVYKKLPERSQEISVGPLLKELADFREPTETASGQYSLKEEFYDEVDPYWHYYSRNDQRAAMDRLLARAKKLTPAVEDPIILPRPLELPPPGTPYSGVGDFLHTHVVSDLVYWAIAHCMHIANPDQWATTVISVTHLPEGSKDVPQIPTWDFVLDYALHLAMIALQVAPNEFAEATVNLKDEEGSHSIFQNLWLMQTSSAFKPWKARVDHILDVVVKHLPSHYTTDYRAHLEAESLLSLSSPTKPDPKAAAKERQRNIMAAFAKQQQDFAALMGEDDDDEDGDESMNEDEPAESETHGQCIVCQEDVTAKAPGGMLALLQPSRLLRESVYERDWLEEHLLIPTSLDRATRYHRFSLDPNDPEPSTTEGYPGANLKFGVYMSACSHFMHDVCMGNYFEATKTRHTQQVQRHHPENAVRLEFMCPLCKSLGNVLIPVESSTTSRKPPVAIKKDGEKIPTLSLTIRKVSSEGLLRVADSQRIWDHHFETGEVIPWFSDCVFSVHSLDHTHRRAQMRSISRMADRMRGLIRPLSEQSQRIRGKKTHMYLPDDMVGYTVSMAEVAHRGLGTAASGSKEGVMSVAEQVNEMSMKLIKKLIGLLQLELDLYFGPSFDRTALRVGIFARFLPDWYRSSTLPSPLLLRRPLGMVIEAAAIAPDLLQSVIVMAYYAELTRVMLGLSLFVKKCLTPRTPASRRSTPPADSTLADGLTIFTGFKPIMLSILRNAGPYTDSDGILSLLTDEMLAKLLYSHTLPFLRRAAIVYYAVSGTYPNTSPAALAAITPATSEYSRLLTLMGIPRPKETLRDPSATETPIVARWLTQWAMQGRVIPSLEFPGTYELLRLPRRWEDIVLVHANRKCGKCGTKPTYPAVCMFCGTMVCLGGDCCSEGEQGECNIHMRECGAVVGMFIDIRRWVILYLYAGSGSFGHMPYLDEHGELDISMRRGHRQYIHVGRMDELRRATWLMHTIPHITARKLELTTDGGGWGCL